MEIHPDETHANHSRDRESPSFWASPAGWVAMGFIGVAGYFLITEHAAHIVPFLPWLLLLACPLMHLFMHHGHHGGHDHGARSDAEDRR